MNWYKIAKQKITILPKVKSKMESVGWIDQFIKELKDIKPITESGIYRISLEESFGGRDFNLKIEASPEEARIIDVVPVVTLESPIRQLG